MMLRLAVILIVTQCLACNFGTSRDSAQAKAGAPNPIVESATTAPEELKHMQLLDIEHWFASDSFKLWKSDNGGRSWTVSYSATHEDNVRQCVRGVSFVSYQIGFLVDRDRLMRTDNAGNNWAEIGTIRDNGGEYFIQALCFVDSLHGWAAGSKLGTSIDASPYVGAVLCTVNGGRTWVRQTVSAPRRIAGTGTRWSLKDLLFMNDKLGWAVGDDVIFWTDNGGEKWWLATVNSGGYPSDYNRVRFLDELHGWSTARDTKEFFVTDDGGRHWERRNGPGQFLGPSAEVAFVNPRRGFAINRFLYETDDSGKSWKRVRNNDPDNGAEYLGIDRARDSSVIAFGLEANGMVTLVSSDGGGTWRKRIDLRK